MYGYHPHMEVNKTVSSKEAIYFILCEKKIVSIQNACVYFSFPGLNIIVFAFWFWLSGIQL